MVKLNKKFCLITIYNVTSLSFPLIPITPPPTIDASSPASTSDTAIKSYILVKLETKKIHTRFHLFYLLLTLQGRLGARPSTLMNGKTRRSLPIPTDRWQSDGYRRQHSSRCSMSNKQSNSNLAPNHILISLPLKCRAHFLNSPWPPLPPVSCSFFTRCRKHAVDLLDQLKSFCSLHREKPRSTFSSIVFSSGLNLMGGIADSVTASKAGGVLICLKG